MTTLAEHNEAELAKFQTETYQDGEEADGSMTPEEQAALAASAAVEVPEGAQAPNEVDTSAAKPAVQVPDPAKVAEKAGKPAAKEPAAKAPEGEPWKPPATQAEYEAAVEAAAKNLAQKRIGDLTKDKRTLERELQAARTTAPATPPASSDKGGFTAAPASGTTETVAAKPDPSKFTFGELDPEYIVALSQHTVAAALASAKAQTDKDQQAQAAAAREAELTQKRETTISAGSKDYPDFQATVVDTAGREEWPLTETMGELIFGSAHGHHVAYYLATHADEATELAKQSPANQAKWFGRVEAAFEGKAPSQQSSAAAKPAAKPAVKAPRAPPPIKDPASAQTTHEVGTDTTDFAAFERLVREQNRR